MVRVKDSSNIPILANKQSGSHTRDVLVIAGRGNRRTGTTASPDSAISFTGAGAGLQTATLCPRLASSRAIGTRKVGKPKSFENSIVDKKCAMQITMCSHALCQVKSRNYVYF